MQSWNVCSSTLAEDGEVALDYGVLGVGNGSARPVLEVLMLSTATAAGIIDVLVVLALVAAAECIVDTPDVKMLLVVVNCPVVWTVPTKPWQGIASLHTSLNQASPAYGALSLQEISGSESYCANDNGS